ncbi:MAG: hypothetical protein HYZ54_11330 [Ignavibacteriae bacterium]|nr:hypothetical protein [Ignavibacteriota bacterium]
MKTALLLIPFIALLAIGCASTKGSQESYFGYSNSPKIESNEPAPRNNERKNNPVTDKSVTNQDITQNPDDDIDADSSQDQDWENPLSDDVSTDDQDSDDRNYSAVPSGYTSYAAPAYVPVVVPWWDYYSGWMGNYYVRPVIAVRYRNWYWGWNSYCDWYSPYYDYHPCYGSSFGYYRPYYNNWGYRNYWRPWHHYPIYTYNSGSYRKPNTVRRWGTGTGVVPSGGKNTVNSPTNVKATSPIRNERGQSTQNPVPNSSNSVRQERSPSTPSIRNERSKDASSGTQQGSSNSNVAPNSNPRSDTPVRRESSDTKPSPRSNTPAPRENSETKPSPRSDTPTRRESSDTKPSPRSDTPVRRESPDTKPSPRSDTPARRENSDSKPAPRSDTPPRNENTDTKPREQAPVRKERPRASIYESSQHNSNATSSQLRSNTPVTRGNSVPSLQGGSSSSPRSSSFSSPSSSSASSSSSSSTRAGRRP